MRYFTDGTHLYELVAERVVQNYGRTRGTIRYVVLRDSVSEETGRVGDLELAALTPVNNRIEGL